MYLYPPISQFPLLHTINIVTTSISPAEKQWQYFPRSLIFPLSPNAFELSKEKAERKFYIIFPQAQDCKKNFRQANNIVIIMQQP